MNSVILLAKAYFKDKASMFWLLVFPIFILLIYGNMYSGGEQQKIPVYLSAEGDWKDALAALNGTFEIRLVQNVENPVQFVLNKTLETRRPATLVVAKADRIDVYSASPIWGSIVSETVKGVVYNVTYSRLFSNIPIRPMPAALPSTPNVTLTVIGVNATSATSLGPARLTTMLMLLQAFGSGITGVAGLIAALVAAGLHKRIALFGASRLKTALSVVAATLIFSLTSTLLLLAVAQAMFKTGYLLLNPHAWIAYFLDFFMFAGMGLLLSNAATQGRAAPRAIVQISVVVYLMFAFMGNYFIPLEAMPKEMAQIALALPTSYSASYAYVAALGGTPTPDVLIYPIAATAALFALGLLLFKPYKRP